MSISACEIEAFSVNMKPLPGVQILLLSPTGAAEGSKSLLTGEVRRRTAVFSRVRHIALQNNPWAQFFPPFSVAFGPRSVNHVI